MGLFGRYFLDAADEVIVIDAHLIGQFTEHAGRKRIGREIQRDSVEGKTFDPWSILW